MLRTYLTITGRNLLRNRNYALLNVAGLAVGLALAFFIGLWVTDELRTDRFHGYGDRLVRVLHNLPSGDGTQTWTTAPYRLGATAQAEVPGLDAAVATSGWVPTFRVGQGEAAREVDGLYADSTFFAVFNFPLVAGDAATVLQAPDAAAVSARLARARFGSPAEALGQPLTLGSDETVTVTGVFADVPSHSTLQFEVVRPMAAVIAKNDGVLHWGNYYVHLYFVLEPGTSAEQVEAGLAGVYDRHREDPSAEAFVQPVADMHLYGRFENGQNTGGRIAYVRLFAIAALVVLVIAAVNFMNLATAWAEERAREIGVRKAVGSGRGALVAQFLGEAVAVALVAFAVAAALVAALLPTASALTGKPLAGLATDPRMLAAALGATLATGLAAGSYPAFYLASFRPARILRGHGRRHAGAARFRQGLVVFQFALSILLLVGTLTVYQQVQYVQTKHLGLDRDNVVVMPLSGSLRASSGAVKQELAGRPGIAQVARASRSPIGLGEQTGDPSWPGKTEDQQIVFHILNVDAGFVETMNMQMHAGRAFDAGRSADSLAFVVNRAAVRAMALEEPLGTPISFWGQTAPVVGVVEDFHFASLHEPIKPLILRYDPAAAGRLVVRTEPGQTPAALASLEAVQQQFAPETPLDYTFLDQAYVALYASEAVVSRLARIFAVAAVFIACLGLFGLAASAAERRTKEIGIRKVLGASVASLFALFSSDFLKLVALVFVVATPVAYLVADRWLDGFAYRIDLGPSVFLAAGGVALVVALATVSVQALRAALADPVQALRAE